MPLHNLTPNQLKAWDSLKESASKAENDSILEYFKSDINRFENFHIKFNEFVFDYSKHLISPNIKSELLQLAEEAKLKDAIEAYFTGDKINRTENRAVLHTALRQSKTTSIVVDGENIVPKVEAVLQQMESFVNKIHSGERKSYAGKAFTDVVNIGIGGSDLGPNMVTEALQFYNKGLKIHFISNVEGDHVHQTLKKINPETTLFLIVSKSFTTQETLTNANTVRKWFLNYTDKESIKDNFVAVSTNLDAVKKFGIASANIYPMYDWVGGRYSLWSSVGLSIALSIGFNNFKALLKGAEEMDQHFRSADFSENIPVISALISIWYNNFLGSESEAIIPYTQYLQKLAPYLQQASMESNGKGVDRDGKKVNYQTGNIVWGEPGTNSQHAFFQLLHQGTKLIPADFIGFKNSLFGDEKHHDILMANFLAQTEALLKGKSAEEVRKELESKNMSEEEIQHLLPFKIFEGNRPTTSILINKLTPRNLGSLIAMYEHKIFVQGVIWNIFSFDQWGVELGKQLANSILKEIKSKASTLTHDQSTEALINLYKS
ncbi:glucose-6-phosphate isomerase [Psychroflexus sp. ALD_RP9]|uniref:glucose-6-phosphate isomerase n=1 Tax=Psychroflexus sp. ALD_RP9 TaxID=2777186 RepID=UPI001A8E83D2|nr:glucose-6-phosphate isomerase [Psychroflexus sp. ALD_RP9]QSS97280.1 glucose-6-phosphate isomerase [Psychroflexus sp. ALD_RP9]